MDPEDAALAAARAKQPPEQHERAHKEALRGLIAAKRDVSYVQLALDLRRSQTTKLETFAVRRTTTLKQVIPLHSHVCFTTVLSSVFTHIRVLSSGAIRCSHMHS